MTDNIFPFGESFGLTALPQTGGARTALREIFISITNKMDGGIALFWCEEEGA